MRLKAEKEELYKSHTADRFRKYTLTRMCFRALRENLIESKQTEQAKLTMCQIKVRLRYLYLTAFTRWASALPALKLERI